MRRRTQQMIEPLKTEGALDTPTKKAALVESCLTPLPYAGGVPLTLARRRELTAKQSAFFASVTVYPVASVPPSVRG